MRPRPAFAAAPHGTSRARRLSSQLPAFDALPACAAKAIPTLPVLPNTQTYTAPVITYLLRRTPHLLPSRHARCSTVARSAAAVRAVALSLSFSASFLCPFALSLSPPCHGVQAHTDTHTRCSEHIRRHALHIAAAPSRDDSAARQPAWRGNGIALIALRHRSSEAPSHLGRATTASSSSNDVPACAGGHWLTEPPVCLSGWLSCANPHF